MSKARDIVEHMLEHDAFSRWLGIKLLAVEPGYCQLSMPLREEMTNGFKIAHGGIAYALADSALAFAANGYGQQSLSIETSIAHTAPVHPGEHLQATATEKHRTARTGLYEVNIHNNKGKLVAAFRGTVYRTKKEWDL